MLSRILVLVRPLLRTMLYFLSHYLGIPFILACVYNAINRHAYTHARTVNKHDLTAALTHTHTPHWPSTCFKGSTQTAFKRIETPVFSEVYTKPGGIPRHVVCYMLRPTIDMRRRIPISQTNRLLTYCILVHLHSNVLWSGSAVKWIIHHEVRSVGEGRNR